MVAPWCTHRVSGFLQYSDRMASLKLKVRGGKVGILTAYAPHNLKPYDERHNFYVNLSRLWEKTSVNGPKYISGDFNARIGSQRPGEGDIVGPFGFGRAAVHRVDVPNRDLLLEFCTDLGYVVANTFEDVPDEQKVTFMEAATGVFPLAQLTVDKLSVLDLALIPQGSL